MSLRGCCRILPIKLIGNLAMWSWPFHKKVEDSKDETFQPQNPQNSFFLCKSEPRTHRLKNRQLLGIEKPQDVWCAAVIQSTTATASHSFFKIQNTTQKLSQFEGVRNYEGRAYTAGIWCIYVKISPLRFFTLEFHGKNTKQKKTGKICVYNIYIYLFISIYI